LAAARELRERAFEAAPAIPGKLNDQPFAWIADADSRLGPVLEAVIEGRYYWVPFYRIKALRLPAPSDLRDLVWMPAEFTWTNGGTVPGHIPSRYPGTETASDGPLRLARKTEWVSKNEDLFLGLGQRLLTTDQAEFPLFEVRQIELAEPGPETV
jgi:type VI secretion system protein ImpE